MTNSTVKLEKVGLNDPRKFSALKTATTKAQEAEYKAEERITTIARRFAGDVSASKTATDPETGAEYYNLVRDNYLSLYGPVRGEEKCRNFMTTALRELKAVGFIHKPIKEKNADGSIKRYLAVNILIYKAPEPKPEPEKETAKKEPAAIASQVPAGTDSKATEAATGKHGADLMPRIVADALQRCGMTAGQLLAIVAGMVPVADLDAAMLAIGYVSQDAAQDAVDKAVKAAKAEKVAAARRRKAGKAGAQ